MCIRNALVVILALSLLLGPAVGAGQAAPLNQSSPPEVLLWNKLGSLDEVPHSAIGPDGAILGSAFAFEPAQFGNGYVREAPGTNYITWPVRPKRF